MKMNKNIRNLWTHTNTHTHAVCECMWHSFFVVVIFMLFYAKICVVRGPMAFLFFLSTGLTKLLIIMAISFTVRLYNNFRYGFKLNFCTIQKDAMEKHRWIHKHLESAQPAHDMMRMTNKASLQQLTLNGRQWNYFTIITGHK